MANRFFSPDQQFVGPNGTPYAGALLNFYASGSDIRQDTFSDSALTIANSNPVVTDSAGRAGSIFLQNLSYKVVLTDASGNEIWSEDPVYASDFSTVAQVQGTNGSPNGQLAGNAGSATIPASMAWDFINNVLYICTSTGNAASAVWTAVNPAGSSAVVIPAPQGRLTLESGTPVPPSDVTSTTIYYTPYTGNTIPVYGGTAFVPTTFSELSCALSPGNLPNQLYDMYVINNDGTPTLAVSPGWANSTAGLGNRGTGGGSVQLTTINGIYVNAIQMTVSNGSTTYSLAPSAGTYVGSIFIDSTAGQVTCNWSPGQSRKWGVWNAYNRTPVILSMRQSNSASWAYNGGVRISDGNPANTAAAFCGLATDPIIATIAQYAGGTSSGTIIGIGVNTTSSMSSSGGAYGGNVESDATITTTASVMIPPALGVTNINAVESGDGTFYGGDYQIMTASWMA